jgi:hypothetical protein
MPTFPRLYTTEACPLDGYEALSFRVLLNPTGAEKEDWAFGHVGITGCADCQAARNGAGKKTGQVYCATCTEARARFGRALVTVYGTSAVAGFDFSSPDAALQTIEAADIPDELLGWLYTMPGAVWQQRRDDIAKKLKERSTAGNSSSA